jgi:hypothetical protein
LWLDFSGCLYHTKTLARKLGWVKDQQYTAQRIISGCGAWCVYTESPRVLLDQSNVNFLVLKTEMEFNWSEVGSIVEVRVTLIDNQLSAGPRSEDVSMNTTTPMAPLSKSKVPATEKIGNTTWK